MKKKLILCTVILGVLLPSTVQADTVVDVYKIYNLRIGDDALKEKAKLDIIEGDFNEIASQVANDNMLDSANKALLVYNEETLVKLDNEIYNLSDKLESLAEKMKQSSSLTVEELLGLDAEYRSIQQLLNKQTLERIEWSKQPEVGISILNPEMESNNAKLQDTQDKLNNQKAKYEKSITYPNIGTVVSGVNPLARDIHITSLFGNRLDPVTKQRIQFHKGTDLRASVGTAVLSAFKGTVEDQGYGSGIGYYVLINHGYGLKTLYGHLSEIQTVIGQAVEQGTQIALSGNSGGRSTGPHLHFAIVINGEYVDPGKLLKGGE